jgi:hypothetical protein
VLDSSCSSSSSSRIHYNTQEASPHFQSLLQMHAWHVDNMVRQAARCRTCEAWDCCGCTLPLMLATTRQ